MAPGARTETILVTFGRGMRHPMCSEGAEWVLAGDRKDDTFLVPAGTNMGEEVLMKPKPILVRRAPELQVIPGWALVRMMKWANARRRPR